MSIQNVLRLLQATKHMMRANASAAAWRRFMDAVYHKAKGRNTVRPSRYCFKSGFGG